MSTLAPRDTTPVRVRTTLAKGHQSCPQPAGNTRAIARGGGGTGEHIQRRIVAPHISRRHLGRLRRRSRLRLFRREALRCRGCDRDEYRERRDLHSRCEEHDRSCYMLHSRNGRTSRVADFAQRTHPVCRASVRRRAIVRTSRERFSVSSASGRILASVDG